MAVGPRRGSRSKLIAPLPAYFRNSQRSGQSFFDKSGRPLSSKIERFDRSSPDYCIYRCLEH